MVSIHPHVQMHAYVNMCACLRSCSQWKGSVDYANTKTYIAIVAACSPWEKQPDFHVGKKSQCNTIWLHKVHIV